MSNWLRPAAPNQSGPAVLNNEISLPLTITMAEASTRFLVLEMGARKIVNIRPDPDRPTSDQRRYQRRHRPRRFGGQNNIARDKVRGPGRGQ
ncbi:hypothetical protein ACFUNF_41730 [Streptomyces sp. NPDC057291]|uniref:hypothetical protein n=1 Tax=Streptomyces sp. NPDC057291 TaxID=3346087 RepID=UPI00362F4682